MNRKGKPRQKYLTDAEGYRICRVCLERKPHTRVYFQLDHGRIGPTCRTCCNKANRLCRMRAAFVEERHVSTYGGRAQPTGLAPYHGEWTRPTEPITLEAWNASCETHLQANVGHLLADLTSRSANVYPV